MTNDERMALIHAELDGDLSGEQRADLARLLLADPQVRALRDQLRGVGSRLDALGQGEPPPELKDSIVSRLPSAPAATTYSTASSFSRWRLAAMVAGLLMAGTIVYEIAQGPAPGSREIAGTMATDAPTIVDSAAVGGGAVTGRATLYRDKSGLAVGLEVSAQEPVDVLISTEGHTFRINGLGSSNPAGSTRHMLALPGVGTQGQDIELSFLIGERAVGLATLHAPSAP